MSPSQSPSLLALVLLLALGLVAVEGNRALAEVGSQPHSVSVRRNGVHQCGGALITSAWVLTTAHCVSVGGGQQSYPPASVTVRVGSIQRLVGGQLIPTASIVIHPSYSSSQAAGANDLALLQLQTPVTLGANVQPIDLATARPPAGSQVTFTDWGSSVVDGALSHVLQVGTRQSISAADCQKELFLEQEDLLCLSPSAEDSAGLCSGSGGAPAVYENQLVGIGAFFAGGCGTGSPDGYVDVTKHLEWIIESSP